MPREMLRVLIIDDDAVDRSIVRRCLSKEQTPSEVHEASSMAEGVSVIAQEGIDVVLLDLGLGVTNGIESLREFRRQAPAVPVLVLSGIEDAATATLAIQEGAQDFIKKDGLEGRWLTIPLINAFERHELQQQLVESTHRLELANKELRHFAYIVSHDLQEPLRAISGYSQLLKTKAKDRLKTNELAYTENIVEGAQRMHQLIEDLLSYSQSGLSTHSVSAVDLNSCMQQSCLGLEEAIRDSDAKVTWENLPTIQANSRQCIQLFQNLIGNALKYTAPNTIPEVAITAKQTAERIQISVADNGIGIKPEYQSQVFELFKRLHSRSEYPGTGVGLAICQKIAIQLGGTIRLESFPDTGSTFTVCLPIS